MRPSGPWITDSRLLLPLDLWPLRRWAAGDVRSNAGLLIEKLPLFALALATGLWTILAQGQAGVWRDSLTLFSHALDPERFKAWNNLGIVLVLAGDPAATEAAWRRSLAIRPDFPDARLNLAKLLDARAQATPGAAGVDDAASGREGEPAPP